MNITHVVSAVILVGAFVAALLKLTDAFAKLGAATKWAIERLHRNSLPIKLGMDRMDVRKKLGYSSNTTWFGDVFAHHGVAAFYNEQGILDGISVSRLPNIAVFSGKLAGVRIGQTYAECVGKLGNPQNWGTPSPYFYIAVWERGDTWVICEIWRQKPAELCFSDVEPQTVKGIWVAAKNSASVYCAIVSLAIEFLRNGARPVHLEDGCVGNVDLKSPIFRKPYAFLWRQRSLGGGMEMMVQFESEPVVVFWIYALSGVNPVIRGIYFAKADSDSPLKVIDATS